MKLTVIVPVFNVEPSLLKACIYSLRQQTLHSDDYEVVIVDDFSDELATLDVLKTHANGDGFRLVRHGKNLGLNEARRTGVKAANGDYIVFVDGDDMLTRDGLELLRMEAHRTNADVVTSWFQRWHVSEKKLSNPSIFRRGFSSDLSERMAAIFRCEHSYTMCGRLFRAGLLSDDVFDMPERVYHEDLVTLPRIMRKAEKISAVQKNVYYYTENHASITSIFSMKHAQDFFFAFSDWQDLAKTIEDGLDYSDAIREGAEKLSATMVRRCQSAENLTAEEKARTLGYIVSKLKSLGITKQSAKFTVIKSLFKLNELEEHLSDQDIATRWEGVFGQLDRQQQAERPVPKVKPKAISDVAVRLKDKIVFIGQVDYQVKNAALAARELRKRGHACVVLDNSDFVAGGKRKFLLKDRSVFWRTEHIKVPSGPYQSDWLATAKAVITFNDFNDDIRDAIEYRQLLGMPTICAVEGINDFARIDFRRKSKDPYRFLPYRRCSTIFLAGENDARFFGDRDARVVGLPIIEELAQKKPNFPKKSTVALNLNFTYGVLEDKRDEFLGAALAGIAAAGFDYQITQHPMDQGLLSGLNVSSKTQYELIDATSVFVSRFATGILEALASGKPAIYFNPHGERVDKFTKPLGAFEIAKNEEELEQALRRVQTDIAQGVDFRERANEFLLQHANYKPGGQSVVSNFADAVIDVIDKASDAPALMHDVFFDRLQSDVPFRKESEYQIFGDFNRDHKAQLNDEEMLARYFGADCSIMIDVGANFGNSCDVYLGKGWTVHAFEPDPFNRSKLLEIWADDKNLIVNEEAVSDKGGEELAFYASDESTGISGLSAFTEGHREVCKVQTTTLRDYYKFAGLTHVDFLKIDVEGFDKFVLDGFPWEADRPEVVLAEFEDNKTVPLGYTIHDLANVMESNGYAVYVSEWHPIVRYGIAHDWRRFLRYDPSLDLSETWGNLIGFKNDPGAKVLRALIEDTIKFSIPMNLTKKEADSNPPSPAALAPKPAVAQKIDTLPPANNITRVKRPFYAEFANGLRESSPKLFGVLQISRRVAAGAWRRKLLTVPAAMIILSLIILSNFRPFDVTQSPPILLTGLLLAISGLGYLSYITYINFRNLAFQLSSQQAAFENTNALSKRIDKIQQEVFSQDIKVRAVEGEYARVATELGRTQDALDNLLVATGTLKQQIKQITEEYEKKLLLFYNALEANEQEIHLLKQETQPLKRETILLTDKAALAESNTKKLQDRAATIERETRFLTERAASVDRQLRVIRFPEAPQCIAFFGHHKCASRFFRQEVFARIAETHEAEVLRYKIEEPPYHYSRMDELDLGNIDFSKLTGLGNRVVMFANGSARSVAALDSQEKNWRGVRVIRDPRQVLVSGYFHHRSDHPTEPNWVWDQLVEDKPILRDLPEEQGVLYELDNISKQVIEEQILGDFNDERILTIRLEDFSLNPSEHLKKISDFLNIADLAGLDLNRTFRHAESRPWQNVFTSKIRKVFKERYGDALIELGYEKDSFW